MAEWQPPNGGYGWVVVMSSFLIMFIFSQPICTFGLYLPVIVEYHQSTTALISIVGSLLLASGSFCGIFIGVLTDLHGCRPTVIFGSICMFLTAITSSIFKYVVVLFICYGFILGIALTCLFNGTIVCIHGYFTTRRAFASSFGIMAISFGSFIWPPLTQYLISRYNWDGTMFIFSAVYLNIIPLGWLLKSTPLTEKKRKESMEHSFVQLVRRCFQVDILRKSFIFYLASSLFVGYSHMIPFVFLPLHAISLEYSANLSALLISVIGVIGLLGRPTLGYVGDLQCVNRTMMFSISAIGTGVSIMMIIFSTEFYQIVIVTAMFAVCAAGYMSVNTSILVDILGLENIARSMGFFLVVNGLANIFSISSAGKLYDAFGDTTAVFLVAGVSDIIGGVLALISYLFQRRDRQLIPLRKEDEIT